MAQQLNSWTPLHAAAAHGYMKNAADIIRLLVEQGADLAPTSCLGEAPIHLASTYSWTRSIAVLLELGADINARTDLAADGIRALSDPQGSPAVHAQTPLMIAAREGQVAAAKLLLENGADVHARDSSGATALHIAARPWWEENSEFVQMLLDGGADPTAIDDASQSPLDLAEAASQALRSNCFGDDCRCEITDEP